VREILGAELERLADQVVRELRAARKAVKRCILCGRPMPKTARKAGKKRVKRKS
jgi:hypothetical protein